MRQPRRRIRVRREERHTDDDPELGREPPVLRLRLDSPDVAEVVVREPDRTETHTDAVSSAAGPPFDEPGRVSRRP